MIGPIRLFGSPFLPFAGSPLLRVYRSLPSPRHRFSASWYHPEKWPIKPAGKKEDR